MEKSKLNTEIGTACDLIFEDSCFPKDKITVIKKIHNILPEIAITRIRYFLEGYLYLKEKDKN
jgi:hypothetical protein